MSVQGPTGSVEDTIASALLLNPTGWQEWQAPDELVHVGPQHLLSESGFVRTIP